MGTSSNVIGQSNQQPGIVDIGEHGQVTKDEATNPKWKAVTAFFAQTRSRR